jgi:NAD(P)-dependent dehydrogenase (short-subunit alcohol dehydrogenase family)
MTGIVGGSVQSNQLRFDGQVALVTGAGGAIGRAYALMLANRGAKVVVMDYPAAPMGSQGSDAGGRETLVAAEIRKAGGEAIGVEGNVFSAEDASRVVKTTLDEYGRLDILVNNAGTTETRTMVYEEPGEFFDPQIDVHIKGPLTMSRAVWPYLLTQKYGRIITTGSASSFGWGDDLGRWKGGYAIAKGAVFTVTRQLAGAGAPHGIKVNMVLPWAWSRMVSEALAGTPLAIWQEKHLTAEKMVAGILLLLHPDCPVNGQAISSAGGRVSRVILAQPKGYFNREVTPEDVRDHWDQVQGKVSADNMVSDMMDLQGTRVEWAYLRSLLGD